jgi:hypothetical protein
MTDPLLWTGGAVAVGYALGRLHAHRRAVRSDRERAFAALAELPDWEIRARALERSAYGVAISWWRHVRLSWEYEVSALHALADQERVRGRARDAERGKR